VSNRTEAAPTGEYRPLQASHVLHENVTTVFRSYRDVLSIPGAPGFTSAGALARLPMSMLGIGIVLLVKSATGSYATAGAVAGVFGLTQAFTSPFLARAVDRFGQSRVMLPAIAVHLAGLASLLISAELHAPRWTVFAAAVIAGATIGSIGSLARARWSYVLAGREPAGVREALLHTAYSLESVLDEVVYITGPLLVTTLAVRLSPGFGLFAAMLAVGIGGVLLLLQHRTEPVPSGTRRPAGSGGLAAPGMIVLLLGMTCTGAIFGSVEVLTVAFADSQHALGAAGWVLACFALGSLLAGLAYGVVHWKLGAGRRFLVAVLLLALGVSPVLLVTNLPQLAVVIFVAGFAISPMLIGGMGLVQELVRPERLTEGLTWVASTIGIGVSAGSAIGGAAVDAFGAEQAFVVPVGAGALAAVIVLLGSRWLRPVEKVSPAVPAEAG
jgi:MFS family permease